MNLFSACGAALPSASVVPVLDPTRYETLKSRDFVLYVGVLYDSSVKSSDDVECLSRLKQSKNLGLKHFALDVNDELSLNNFNILFLDDSILKNPGIEGIIRLCVSFAEAGGFVCAENCFLPIYDKLLGSDLKTSPLEEMPASDEIFFPAVTEDMREMQEILNDFFSLYSSYGDSLKENRLDCGYSIKSGKGFIPLSSFAGGMLSAIAPANSGATLFLPDIIPDKQARQNFELKALNTGLEYYSDSSLSAARLMESAFMAYAARSILGFSLERNWGTYTRPSLSFTLPLDTAAVKKSMQTELISRAQKLGLVTSYSISDLSLLESEPVCVLSFLESIDASGNVTEKKYSSSGISGQKLRAGHDVFFIKPDKQSSGAASNALPSESVACSISAAYQNADKSPDFLIGNSQGDIMLAMGNLDGGRYILGPPVSANSNTFNTLNVPGPSAPIGYDINFDGIMDIVCGTGDGRLVWFEGYNGMNYKPGGELLKVPDEGRVIPAIGDINSDRYPDILLSTENGKLLIYFGEARGGFSEEYSEVDIPGYENRRLAPVIYDINSDNLPDILLGTDDGFILKLIQNPDGSFSQAGFVESNLKNSFGDFRVWIGSCASPAVTDLNFDGKPDLVVAGVSKNLAVPADDIPSAYQNLIIRAAAELVRSGYYVGLRPSLGLYSDASDEVLNINGLFESVKYRIVYGNEPFGADMFGRQINALCPEQSFSSIAQSKASWISSYRPAEIPSNALALPFYFTHLGKQVLPVQNSAEFVKDSLFANLSAKYEIPLKVNPDSADPDEIFELAEQTSEFKYNNFYTSLMENQLVFALTAAMNFDVKVSGDTPLSGNETELLLIPKITSGDNPLLSDSYSRAVGVVMTLSDKLDNITLGTDADIYYRAGNKLYFSLDRAVRIFVQEGSNDPNHIAAVNLPCRIYKNTSDLEIEFLEPGFKELVYKGNAELLSYGWQKTQKGDYTYFFADSSKDRLVIKPSD